MTLYISMFSQKTDVALIEETLQNYIEGSAYNKIALLESAFTEDATLYLTTKEGFKRLTPKDYSHFFKQRQPGVFNGRFGEILAIEHYKDIANAKVKISIPKMNWVFIDLFLLKKTEAGWKIISKTATRLDNEKK